VRPLRRIYVIEVDQRPRECHFKRRNAEVAMATYRLRAAMPPEIVPYAQPFVMDEGRTT
jgi:hypothetical protein